MKKFGFLIPILLFLGFSVISRRLFASGGINPTTILIITAVFFGVMLMSRPKNKAPKSVSDLDAQIRGDFAKDAFTDDSPVSRKFQSAVKDFAGNMPKSATRKLAELANQCRNDQERYAHAMASALCASSQQNFKEAIRHYNKAIVLNPTAELALTLGSCQQRIGELSKAQDSYEFALELEPDNLEVRSNLATSYVADGDYETGLEHALMVLEKKEDHASALATAAICYGMLDNSLLKKHYTKLAVENGYKESKINDTISALKKR